MFNQIKKVIDFWRLKRSIRRVREGFAMFGYSLADLTDEQMIEAMVEGADVIRKAGFTIAEATAAMQAIGRRQPLDDCQNLGLAHAWNTDFAGEIVPGPAMMHVAARECANCGKRQMLKHEFGSPGPEIWEDFDPSIFSEPIEPLTAQEKKELGRPVND